MKKLTIAIFLVPMLLFAQSVWNGTIDINSWYTGNESATTYTLTTAEQLAGLAQLVNNGTATFSGKAITLGANIALNDTNAQGGWRKWNESNAPANKWIPIGNAANNFKGKFDGNSKVVSGLYINNSNADYQGLFGVASDGSISNLGLTGFYLAGGKYAGSIVGFTHCMASNNNDTQYCSDGVMRNYGALHDNRDGKTYKIVIIGTQIWMAENLNYNVNGSKCHKDLESNCNTYGRLYDWNTAITACPIGWHLSSYDEWYTLIMTIDYSMAGKKLKAINGWNTNDGTDNYGFSALPAGNYSITYGFSDIYGSGYWWNTREYDTTQAWMWMMSNGTNSMSSIRSNKSNLFSVRCLKD
ncbi:MAG: fibrobacter succinogenes major paralogous domain-containing protein [Fibromonadales bacterium]|nr:fibrobacter succinogenes major paralogous domain-containing protein [Fibromonadales bacterium]